jgi:hypothetical protein
MPHLLVYHVHLGNYSNNIEALSADNATQGALQGQWVQDLITTGPESWRPLSIILLCSMDCVTSSLTKADVIARRLGTMTAFAMTSRWLVMVVSSVDPSDRMSYSDVTLDDFKELKNNSLDNVCVLPFPHNWEEQENSKCVSMCLLSW